MEARLARSASDAKVPADVPSSATSPVDEDEEVRVVLTRGRCKHIMSPHVTRRRTLLLTNACNANVSDGILHWHFKSIVTMVW